MVINAVVYLIEKEKDKWTVYISGKSDYEALNLEYEVARAKGIEILTQTEEGGDLIIEKLDEQRILESHWK